MFIPILSNRLCNLALVQLHIRLVLLYKHTIQIKSNFSYLTCGISHMRYHISYIVYHISHSKYHISHITYNISHGKYYILYNRLTSSKRTSIEVNTFHKETYFAKYNHHFSPLLTQ